MNDTVQIIAATVAIILASNGAVWLTTRHRAQEFEGKLTSLQQAFNRLNASTRSQINSLEKSIRSLDTENTIALKSAKEREGLDEEQPHPTELTWNITLSAIWDSLALIKSNLEWHARWLDTLSDPTDDTPSERLHAQEIKLRGLLQPRLYEVILGRSDAGKRSQAAQALATAHGDGVSLERLGRLAAEYPELERHLNGLRSRLLSPHSTSETTTSWPRQVTVDDAQEDLYSTIPRRATDNSGIL